MFVILNIRSEIISKIKNIFYETYYIIKKNEKLYTTYIISLRDISEKLLLII